MEPWIEQLASRLRVADSFFSIVSTLIAELEVADYRSVAVIAHDATGVPAVWAGNACVDREQALAYLSLEHIGDPGLAEVRRTLACAATSSCTWVVPILGCAGLIGTIRLGVGEHGQERDRRAELTLIGTVVSVRLALLGMEAPLAQHVRSALTDRQHEVAYLVARGCTNAEIGSMLAISANAVKKHVSRVLEMMGVSNRTELAAYSGRWSADRPDRGPVVIVEYSRRAA